MALINLRSDLSWHGTTAPGPYKPPADKYNTKFKGADDVPYVSAGGYEFQGISLVAPVQRFAGDSFTIDSGMSSRMAQLGSGTPSPYGEYGHDIDRLGFHFENPYGDIYGNQSNAGLANTYTENSPIDDMYNKFNLRDDATPNSYIKHPLILRGIQRQGKTDNQRWGLDVGPGMSGAFDIPRGGIITAVNRTLIDVVRHAKFLASPRGIGFLAKQVGYQLMNPKAETRIYNPLSLGSLAPIVHINRQFGEDGIAGGLIKKLAGDKIDLHEALKKELFTQQQDITKGSEISTLSSKIGGPGSLLGLLGTSITRHEDTRLAAQWGADLSIEVKDYETRQFKYDNPYQQTNGETGGLYTIKQIDDGDNIKGQTNTRKLHGSLKETLKDRASGWGFRNDLAPNGWIGGGRFKASSNVGELDYTGYATNNYEALVTAAKKSTRAGNPNTTTVNDFLTEEDYNTELRETRLEKEISSKPDANGVSKDFDGGGTSAGDRSPGNEFRTNTYKNLKDIASDRTPKTTKVHDFRTKRDYNKTHKETFHERSVLPSDGLRRNAFDGGGAPRHDQTSEPKSDNIAKDYTRMAYGAIPKRSTRITPENIDFREMTNSPSTAGKKRWGEDKRIDELDADLHKSLIKFKFGTLNFKAYLGSLNDSFAPSWNGQADQGRADPRYLYEGFERTMTLDFLVPIMSKDDRIKIWKKLEDLAHLTYPVYKTNGFHGQTVRVTIGDLFVKKHMIITDLGYSWDTENPWEIDEGHQAPMYTNVSLSFTILGDKPTSGTPVYGQTLTRTKSELAEAAKKREEAKAKAEQDKKDADKKKEEKLVHEKTTLDDVSDIYKDMGVEVQQPSSTRVAMPTLPYGANK